MINRFFITIKWKYLRWKVKRQRINFRKCMVRMYYIQELEKLSQYNTEQLVWFNYSKLRKMFIKEFPNKHLHNPYKD